MLKKSAQGVLALYTEYLPGSLPACVATINNRQPSPRSWSPTLLFEDVTGYPQYLVLGEGPSEGRHPAHSGANRLHEVAFWFIERAGVVAHQRNPGTSGQITAVTPGAYLDVYLLAGGVLRHSPTPAGIQKNCQDDYQERADQTFVQGTDLSRIEFR